MTKRYLGQNSPEFTPFSLTRNAIRRITGSGRALRVLALGTRGESLQITGNDRWGGGVGITTTNETFGGDTIDTGRWNIIHSDTYEVDFVGSRKAVFIAGLSGGSGSIYVHSIATGQQDVDGNLKIECLMKKQILNTKGTWNFGLRGDAGTAYFQSVTNNETTQIEPYIKNTKGVSANETGSTIVISNDAWIKFKIIVKSASVEFYVNGILEETLTSANAIPNNNLMAVRFTLSGVQAAISGTFSAVLRIKRVKADFGAV